MLRLLSYVKRSSRIWVLPLPVQVAWLIWSFAVMLLTIVPRSESDIIDRL
ncbi:hypothetical protein I5498_11795, partial [Citrobacter amalonaticus]|nr:hypothetical protein [Citrobacter amalonaticus]